MWSLNAANKAKSRKYRGIFKVKKSKKSKFDKTDINSWSISKSQKRNGTRCPEGLAFPADMPHPLQMLH